MKLKDPIYVRSQIALKGYSERGFAIAIKVTSGYLSRVLNGIQDPSPVVAKKIADGIGKKISDIFFTVDGRKSDTELPKQEVAK